MERMLQTRLGRGIILYAPIALREGTVGTCRLVYIAILHEEIERTLGKVTCQELARHLLHIEILKSRQIVLDQEVALLCILYMLADGLQCIRLPIRIRIAATCQHIALDEIVKLSLRHLIGRIALDGATRAKIIKIIEILGGILLQNIRVDVIESLHHRSFQLHIIEISGSHDVKLGACIHHALALPLGQIVILLLYTAQTTHGTLTISIKILVAGFTLAKSHILNVGNKEFYLVVGACLHLVEPSLG